MLHLCIATTPPDRIIVSMLLPEDAAEDSQLGALIADLGCLVQLGLPDAVLRLRRGGGLRDDVTTEVAVLTAYRTHRRALASELRLAAWCA
jgi:hypothetical protein